MTEQVHAEITVGSQQWAVSWNRETNTDAYMVSQLAFEAKRAAQRELTWESS